MTQDDQLATSFEELSCDETSQQEQKPFHIVLIDIKQTAKEKNIKCIKTPLLAENLQYVALSYRWGELQEMTIDTKLGYAASITSFDVNDFYRLCHMMTQETDLRSIPYVWVDAICVNQTNHTQRKATIHQMSHIYERATYILAVPDLHLQHLKAISTKNKETIDMTWKHSAFIYHVIQGHIEPLFQLDKTFIDEILLHRNYSEDYRQLVVNISHYFTGCFIKNQGSYLNHNAEELFNHLQASRDTYHPLVRFQKVDYDSHHCNSEYCPFKYFNGQQTHWEYATKGPSWSQQINERNRAIKQSMEFLTDLIQDWSSRVWVISEYTIAKKKKINNFRYWFIQLDVNAIADAADADAVTTDNAMAFETFKFDFHHDGNAIAADAADAADADAVTTDDAMAFKTFKFDFQHDGPLIRNPNRFPFAVENNIKSAHLSFQEMLTKQLATQSFLEMMLKSKASKNEDRFYSILPLSDKYKHHIKDMQEWGQITTCVAVRLQLFKIMTTKDRLTLLFLSGNETVSYVGTALPTFATSCINWERMPLVYRLPNDDDGEKDPRNNYNWNFDLTTPSSAITLCHNDSSHQAYLNVTPILYNIICDHDFFESEIDKRAICELLELHPCDDYIDFVVIRCFDNWDPREKNNVQSMYFFECEIIVAGNFAKNKWMLFLPQFNLFEFDGVQRNPDSSDYLSEGFHIY